jgi:Transposase DDE domain
LIRKYALGLDLGDSGFDASVLSEFRSRLCEHGLSNKLLDLMLLRFQEKNLIKYKGKQRTDSTQVLAAIRQLNRLELVGETLRFALNEIAETSAEWLKEVVSHDWFDRYSWRFDNYRLPKNKSEREQLALLIGFNGHYLLQKIWSESDKKLNLIQLRSVEILRKVWIQQYAFDVDGLVWRRQKQTTKEFEKDDARRAGVEGTISQAVGRFNVRQARYFGIEKTHLQHVATACAINLSRFFSWSKQIIKAGTRTSSFASLNSQAS